MLSARSTKKNRQFKCVKNIQDQSFKQVIASTSRRQPSSRCEIENKNVSFLTIDTLGVCPGPKHKKASTLTKSCLPLFEPALNIVCTNSEIKKASVKKQCSSTKKPNDWATGCLKVSNNNLVASTKNTKGRGCKKSKVNTNYQTVNHKNRKQAGKVQSCQQRTHKISNLPHCEDQLTVEGRRKRQMSETIKSAKKSEPREYLIREPTLAAEPETADVKSLNDIGVKTWIKVKQHSQIMVDWPQVKEQQQKQYGQAVKQLKETNCKLQQEIAELERKSEAALEQHKKQLDQIQRRNLDKLESASKSLAQMQSKLSFLERHCETLHEEKSAIENRLRQELVTQTKNWQEGRAQLKAVIAKAQHQITLLSAQIIKLQGQSSHFSTQFLAMQVKKQKLERMIINCEKEVQELEAQLEKQTKANKQQLQELLTLRKEKTYIKQNSELVLEIVRHEIRELKLSGRQRQNELNLDGSDLRKSCILQQAKQ